MKSLQEQIVKYLYNKQDWVENGVILNETWKYDDGIKTYLPTTVSRELRSAESGEDGESRLAVKDDPNSKSIVYKFIPPEFRHLYIPFSQRTNKDILFRKEDLEEKPVKNRTLPQNNSIHLYLQLLSDELNNAGLDMKAVLKPEVDIPWTVQNAKEYLWRPIQKALLHKESTTNLETSEVSQVWEILNRHLGEKFGIHVAFPSEENTSEYLQSIKE